MSIYTTEITSDELSSDNPIHQRLLKPYYWVKETVYGEVLELGCGEGRGIDILAHVVKKYVGIDKNGTVIDDLNIKYPDYIFKRTVFPPIDEDDNRYDFVISFQVIEHIKKDRLFLEEIKRVLKPGGNAILTTPNIKMSLSRNPWHIREYTSQKLTDLAGRIFGEVSIKGITGNEKVMQYYDKNRRSVRNIMKWDVLNLQYRLPACILKVPYEIMNRLNRNKLQKHHDQLVTGITHNDYLVTENTEDALDLVLVLKK